MVIGNLTFCRQGWAIFRYNGFMLPENLLRTKLFIPPTRPSFVPRAHLLGHLSQGLQEGCRLSLVAAPAGFGKTTLLSHWSTQEKAGFAWINLDHYDNDPGRFLAYLYGAMETLGVELDLASLAVSKSTRLAATAASLIPLINRVAQATGPYVLVLDDYHHIENQDIHHSPQNYSFTIFGIPAKLFQ